LTLALWFDKLSYFIKHSIWFLCFNYNKNSKNQYDKYWPIKYFSISALYFFIFAVFFFFSGFEDISQVIFLSWFGVMAIRLLHFVPGSYNTCKLLGELLFTTFIPFGILLEIGLLFFKKYVIVWEGMIVYIVFSIMFILSILFTEILLAFFIEYFKKRKMQNPSDLRGKNMRWSQIYNKIKFLNIVVKLGFIPFILGIILILLGKTSFFGYISCYELGLWFTSFSFAIIALGYAIDSDEKMKQSQNMHFLGILNDIEYTRMMYINIFPGSYHRSTFIWRTLRDIERIAEINRNLIKPKYQQEFVSYFCGSIVELFNRVTWKNLTEEEKKELDWKLKYLENGEKSQIIKMFIIILNYEKEPDEKRLDTLTTQMGRPENETVSDFINRLRVEYNIQIEE
jgi:hypothetical protein